MSSEAPLTTAQVEDGFAQDEWDVDPQEEAPRRERFRRWHAAELRKARVEALREASNALSRQPSTCKSPGCHRADQIILDSLADQVEEDQ